MPKIKDPGIKKLFTTKRLFLTDLKKVSAIKAKPSPKQSKT